ncbi:MAG TPA: biotin/lipoyl-containing protein [Candidatus Acidoferrum sp.]|nr:biotin/lipoyl-containing protein [Candidatus Acidoferrum sp.]
MKFEVRMDNRTRTVEFQSDGTRWHISLDGEPVDADAIEIAPNIFSILLDGKSHEVRITPMPAGGLSLQTAHREFTAEIADPRAWRGRRHSALEAEGRQQVLSPMPGKIVRVLIQAGDKVEAGQGLIVVEAMKMQNAIHSPKTGTVERLLVKEGQPVNAGEVLAWIE